jgi:hypothetical protein
MAQEEVTQDQIIEDEKKFIGITDPLNIRGLAITGGGIRSASFGLGVMQALVGNKQMEKIQYMSTVSGGGYLGSALTWALHQYRGADTTKENFPLGKKAAAGAKDANKDEDELELEGNELLDFIRLHGSYLTPIDKLDIVSFAAVVLRSMVMSLFVYLSFITVVLTAALFSVYQLAHFIQQKHLVNIGFLNKFYAVFEDKGLMIMIGLILICFMILVGFGFSLSTFYSRSSTNNWYQSFIKGQKWMGWMLKFAATCFVLGSLPYVAQLLENIFSNVLATASGSTVFGAAVGIWQYVKASKNEKNTGGSSDLLIYAGAFALIYGVLLFAYVIATDYFLFKPTDTEVFILQQNAYDFRNLGAYFILLFASLFFGFFVNLNALGPHFIWRSRLMEAFMPDKKAVRTNKWMPATKADGALMKDMCWKNDLKPGPGVDISDKCKKPYHIVNTNVILPKSDEVKYSGRGGDNFIISPLYCGSDATGFKSTEDFQKGRLSTTKGITLASAMATSAAALNPNAGVSGEGVTRNAVVSILLSMLNLRLGYWTRNPKTQKLLGSPNFFKPGLWTEILRNGFSETADNILLSDGGHFENLAIYELVRRKCSLIIVSDGGEDHKFNFDDLANAIEKVRVDFGTRVKFMNENQVDLILPGSSGEDLFQKKYNISKRGYAFADIFYPGDEHDKPSGKLVYVKLAMIEGLATDVYSYKGVNPTFPHESTADQFFNEKQFEAYRELGYYVAWQMMLSKEGKELFPEKEISRPFTNDNKFKASGDVHSRSINLLINDINTGDFPRVINYPIDLQEVGATVADEISFRYRYFKFENKDKDVADWPLSGTIEVSIDNLTYRFTYDMKKFPELPDEIHFYVKLNGDRTDMIWHSTTELPVG